MASFFPGLCTLAPHGFVFLTSNNKSVSESVCWRCLFSDRKASIAYAGCPCQQLTNPAPAPAREARGWARGAPGRGCLPCRDACSDASAEGSFQEEKLLQLTSLTPWSTLPRLLGAPPAAAALSRGTGRCPRLGTAGASTNLHPEQQPKAFLGAKANCLTLYHQLQGLQSKPPPKRGLGNGKHCRVLLISAIFSAPRNMYF